MNKRLSLQALLHGHGHCCIKYCNLVSGSAWRIIDSIWNWQKSFKKPFLRKDTGIRKHRCRSVLVMDCCDQLTMLGNVLAKLSELDSKWLIGLCWPAGDHKSEFYKLLQEDAKKGFSIVMNPWKDTMPLVVVFIAEFKQLALSTGTTVGITWNSDWEGESIFTIQSTSVLKLWGYNLCWWTLE